MKTALFVASAALLLTGCGPDQDLATAPVRAAAHFHADAQTAVGVTGPILSGIGPNLCADVRGASMDLGAPVKTYTCHGGENQQWTLQSSGAITVYNGARCLDAAGAQGNDGDAVIVWSCNGQANQRWTQTAAGELIGINGKCLDVAGGSSAPGSNLIIWPCHGGASQKWTFANAPSAVGTAELPRVYLNTAMPTVTGRTLTVAAGGDLQAALDAAQPGDEIVLAPGASYVGSFTLPAKAGMTDGQWITVRSAGVLPAEGTRVGPGDAGQMPKILTQNADAAIKTAPGAQGWRLMGVEVGATSDVSMAYALVSLGGTGSDQNTLAQVPSRLVLDRDYIHGTATLDVRRCVALNSASTAVIDSYVSECHSHNGDSQALFGWNGPGPFKIVNNHLEGGHENLGFGGADPSVPGLIPSDIEIRRNHVIKPLAWRGVWTGKNLLEIKAGQRVLIEANVFENNWADGQNGFAFVWWSANADGNALWSVTQDVTFRYNVVRNVAGGFNLADHYNNSLPPMSRVTITHNVITGLDGSNGRMYQIVGAVAGVTITNNSGLGVKHDLTFTDEHAAVPSLVFQNNVTGGEFTLFAPSTGEGPPALAQMGIPPAQVTGNVFAATHGAGVVPSGNAYAGSIGDIGFTDYAGGNLQLTSASPYRTAGIGGSVPGADVVAVNSRTQGVVQ